MTLRLSKRSGFIVQSEIRNMSIECERVGGINLSQGVCDTPIPAEVRRAAQAAIESGPNSYTRYDGIPELRRALAMRLARHNKLEVDPDSELIVSAGSTGAFYCACMALLDPGDEIVLFEPFYGYHVNTLLAVEAVPVYVPMKPPEWTFLIEDLEAVVTARTRGIMLCTPANPCGKVWSRTELELIADFAERHDLFVFTDEVYEHLVYDGGEHISPATLARLRPRTITMGSLSKTFSITGWRIGYAAADAKWARMIGYMNDLVYVCAPAPLQLGVARGLESVPDSYYTDLRDEYRQKRDLICLALKDSGLTPYVPRGAYYVLADLSRIAGSTSKDRAMKLLELTGVATVPGESFYRPGRGESIARFCFAKTMEDLTEACKRLRRLA
jgi:aminotransferase